MKNEQTIEYQFVANGPFYHYCTPGDGMEILMSNSDDFKFGVNALAVAASRHPDVKIITFEWMNNHLHLVLRGDMKSCDELFDDLKAILASWYRHQHRAVDLSSFVPTKVEISSLEQLRAEIVYVNRNGFLVSKDNSPFSYRWGAGPCFFNDMVWWGQPVQVKALSVKALRELTHSRNPSLPDDWLVAEGMVLPSSFVDVAEAESYFTSARQYLHLLFRKVEAYGAVARRLGESPSLDDEEMFEAARSIGERIYAQPVPKLLTQEQKMEVARRLHFEYRASNRQIESVLKLPRAVVNEMFPG